MSIVEDPKSEQNYTVLNKWICLCRDRYLNTYLQKCFIFSMKCVCNYTSIVVDAYMRLRENIFSGFIHTQ